MENNANQLSQNLCKKNCGFFGSSMFDGYCSKCHKEHVKRQNSGTAAGVLQTTQSSSNLNNSNIPPPQQQPPIDIPLNELTTTTNATNNETTTTTTTTTATPIIVDEQQVQPTVQSSLPDNTPIEIDNVQTPSTTQIEQQSTIQQQQQQQQQENAAIAIATNTVTASETESMASSSVNDDGTSKKKKTRCMVDTCRRKVGLTGFECRCNGLYCWEHRYSDKHNCQFDYKEFGQDQIRKNNPIVVGEKIQKL